MKMIQALVRPEKSHEVVDSLEKAGIHAFTRLEVFGRGRQKGIQVGLVRYEELAKVWLMIAIDDEEADRVMETIKIAARTGNPGDGKLFLSSLEEVRTIRTGETARSQPPEATG
ncbi:MAG: P-II family nitrogen regulator [Nitrospirota bacterium]